MPLPRAPQDRKFRAACDPCHTRKIRCKTALGAAVCEDCASNNRACFYTPCRRPGRPRALSTAPAEASVGELSQPVPRASRSAFSTFQPSTSTSQMPEVLQDMQDPSHSETDLSMDCFPFVMPISFDKASNPLSSFALDVERAVYEIPTPLNNNPSQYKNDDGFFTEGPLEYDPSKRALFSAILRMYTDLQFILEASQPLKLESWSSEPFILGLLQSETPKLDHAGHELINTLTLHKFDSSAGEPSEKAILSLVMAGSFKMLEICNVWTDNICLNGLHINHTLLLRRVDGNLVQLRTLLTQLKAVDNTLESVVQDGLMRSAQLHSRIEDVIKKGWENLN